MTAGGKLTDPDFTVDSHGGYCVVRIADSLSVVIINEVSSVIVEVYHDTEDDSPIETMQFSKDWSEK
jgi:hypothetical protein